VSRLIWLSDLHYMVAGDINGHDPRVRINLAIDTIRRDFADADAVIITGDLAEHGYAEDYAALAKIMDRLPMPVLSLLGNHDQRAAFAAHISPPETAMASYRQFTHLVGDVLVMALDTPDGETSPGQLCSARMEWITDTLRANRDKRVIVAMHHPPVALGLPNQDHERVVQGDALMELLADHGNVAQILCGHVHRQVQMLSHGIPVTSARSVTYQAPALRPHWDWDSFAPPLEAPSFGIVDVDQDTLRMHDVYFCDARDGVSAKS